VIALAYAMPAVLEAVFLVVITACLAMLVIRLFIGPTNFDRLAAFECLALVVMSVLVVWAVRVEVHWLFDAIIVLSLFGYLGTVSVAKYLERGTLGGD
jgi:multisubunit Na+/H+ antiporter MnhF subunit